MDTIKRDRQYQYTVYVLVYKSSNNRQHMKTILHTVSVSEYHTIYCIMTTNTL